MSKIRVMHLLQSNRFSGAENVVCQIISLMKNNPEVEMIYCSLDGQIQEALNERNIRFLPIADITFREVKRVINEWHPNLIHAHDMRASFIASRVCGAVPIISHIHNNNFDSRGLSVKSIAYLFAAYKAKHIFWVSRSSYEGYYFRKLFAIKSTVLYNIIDIDSLYKRMQLDFNQYSYDVIFIGRLTFQKNPQRLLKVFRLVVDRKPDIKIAIVGTGELEEEIVYLRDKLKLVNNVKLFGFQSNPLKILRDSKVMVMTSRWEGTPMCALESLALGVPVVSTPTDGLKELIKNGVNGFLCERDNEIANNILRIVTDEVLHSKLSRKSYQESLLYNDRVRYCNEILKCYFQ